jgi:hypothetical protein
MTARRFLLAGCVLRKHKRRPFSLGHESPFDLTDEIVRGYTINADLSVVSFDSKGMAEGLLSIYRLPSWLLLLEADDINFESFRLKPNNL